MNNQRSVGVLLMTYGSPDTLDDVLPYMTNVYGGRTPDLELVQEFRRRYDLIGGSPLAQITLAQAVALGDELQRRHPEGPDFYTGAGMRFSPPYISDAMSSLASEGIDRLVCIIMSPQYSPILMSGYIKTVEEAQQRIEHQIATSVAGSWHRQPLFLQAVADRVNEALAQFPPRVRGDVQVLLTAHSMPKPVIEKEPNYIKDLHETATLVAALAGLPRERWQFCYQSAGHTPEEWLKPDFADIMPELAAAGRRHVLIAPVQFLADHLEILYDIEIGAREQAEQHGLIFMRASSLNTAPRFIGALADVVEGELASLPAKIPTPA
ncbi:MAG: hemH [Chloroflexi bacterium]|nr:hemH [Chloroflexota bacterium]